MKFSPVQRATCVADLAAGVALAERRRPEQGLEGSLANLVCVCVSV